MMKNPICQSCAMPMESAEQFGTNADGSRNEDYCVYCMQDGNFTHEQTLEQMVESSIPFVLEDKVFPDAETARAALLELYPKLKRWQSQTAE